ncbi:hypothetical protein JSE7799_01399 [Jannaschia seosinensis]|uniref:Uncharacterized protein n=1 Tax=Jannaschia seosinensis TaxID=313367 RepID=A0A0M7BA46_9RHOB|nr:hypothetical protein [Jannaschia seosinensis]CUH38352.1 hypothetical protein JSE7799_01399 [Jannaschia seosinensis]
MIRPELAARLRPWREALIGVGALTLGLWLAVATGGIPALLGLAAMAVGLVLAVSGLRRARLSATGDAPGMVEVIEGRVTYMGPTNGGTAELDDMTEIVFVRPEQGPAGWVIAQDGGAPLMVPDGALGADKLLDALSALPGLNSGAMVRATRTGRGTSRVIWRRHPSNDHSRALT